MTDIPPTATDLAEPRERFSTVRAIGSILFSVVVNAVFPYLIYRALAPKFPSGSVVPLLVSTIFPLFGLSFSIWRRRSADYIAIISLVEISASIIVTIVAQDVRLALIARALQGTITGVFFLATIVVGRPLFYYVARQFVAASSPKVSADFEAAHKRDRGRTFRALTALWGVGTILVSLVNLAIAMNLPPATYLLVAPIISIGMNVVMIVFTIRYSSSRFRRQAA
jgi:hypothetical protein